MKNNNNNKKKSNQILQRGERFFKNHLNHASPFFSCSDYHYGTANRLCRKTLASDFLVI